MDLLRDHLKSNVHRAVDERGNGAIIIVPSPSPREGNEGSGEHKSTVLLRVLTPSPFEDR